MTKPLSVTFVMTHPQMMTLWLKAQKALAAQGITLTINNQMSDTDWTSFIPDHVETADAVYSDITRSAPMFDAMVEAMGKVPCVVASGIDLQASGLSVDPALYALSQDYLRAASGDNLVNLVLAMLHAAGKINEAPKTPTKPLLMSTFWPDTDELWSDAVHFLDWYATQKPGLANAYVVPVLQDRTSWLNGDLALMDHAIASLEQTGLVPMPIFIDFELGTSVGAKDHPLEILLRGVGKRIGAIWNNAVVHGTRAEAVPEGGPFGNFHVPVIQLVRNWSDTSDEWKASSMGLGGMSLTFSLTRPEVMGCIDPTIVACTEVNHDQSQIGAERKIQVLNEQVDRLAERTAAWVNLQHKPNAEKQVVIFLHNPPCKGLEATIGNAAGLDALQSTVDILNRMNDEGYQVCDIPEDGKALLDLFLEKKAISEFRWTNVAEIVSKGGALTTVDEVAFRKQFDALPKELQEAVNEAWGVFPAKAMVKDPDSDHPSLVVTGLDFGNIRVMTDPKRGCYGPKCDGEVCRILHEPDIAPTHHWLATYWYVQDTADAVIHMGTEGPLEYLPGKRAGLSEDCYPYLSIGNLPSIYPYIMNCTGEAMLAKRRGRAVLIDHLSAPIANSGEVTEKWSRLEDLHRQYSQSEVSNDDTRRANLRATLIEELVSLGLCSETASETDIVVAIDQLPRRLQILKTRKVEIQNHVFGQVPEEDIRVHYRSELRGLTDRTYDETAFEAGLNQTHMELDTLMTTLSGGFVQPGLSGHLSQGKADVVPTGRNIFGVDLKTIPTAAAYEVGARMGERMLQNYLAEEEGAFPQTVGITLWSSDAFQADGELAAQILWLLGVRVDHDNGGRVIGVSAIPADELTMSTTDGETIMRPRIDVLVQMSSVVRDTLIAVYGWLDKAVQIVSELDEPAEVNYLRAHIQQRFHEIMADVPGQADSGLKRLAACRIFSTKDGAYSDGLALALDASAWEDDEDLAEIVVNWNSAAYDETGNAVADGDNKIARLLMDEYATALKGMDISYQKVAPGSDILKYGCYLGTQAGNSVVKRGLGKGAMRLYWGDSQSSSEGEVRTVKEELTLSLAHSVLNQEWIDFRKGDGYAGASDVSGRVNHLFQWSATTHEVSNAQFDAVHDILISNEKNRKWLLEENPYALEEVTRRLLEADARNLWDASEERRAELHMAVLTLEGDLEDRMGPVTGEFQGSSVDIKSRKTVKEWSYDFRVK